MNARTAISKAVREVTGTTVLACFVGFFGIIATVNAIMMYAAITTFAGTETASSYKASLAYKAEEAAASAQTKLNWQVEGRIVRTPSGEAVLTVDLRDQNRLPVYGVDVSARLAHPLNARLDHDIALSRIADGGFRGTTEASVGQWTLTVDVKRGSERIYRTKSRVVLK
jgi:nitrogen fixation protein FixH